MGFSRLPQPLLTVTGTGNVPAAQLLAERLPPELPAHGTQGQAAEHVHYRDLLALWRAHEALIQMGVPPPESGGVREREARIDWVKEYSRQLEDIRARTVNMLTNEWLTSDRVDGQGEKGC